MQETLKNNQYTLRDRVYNLLTCVTNYDKFSHDATGGIDIAADGLDSIESIHNQMHVLGGDTGHMGEVDYAAFDPIFWLHHANVCIFNDSCSGFSLMFAGRSPFCNLARYEF